MAKDPFVEEYLKGMAAVRKSRPKKRAKLSLGKGTKVEPRFLDELKVENRYKPRERNPQAEGDGSSLTAGYDTKTDQAFRAIGNALGNQGPTEALRFIDDNLLGIGNAEQAAFNVGRGEGTGWDAVDLAFAAPVAGAVAKPFGALARGIGRVTSPMAARIAETAPMQYLREARPLVDNADDAAIRATLNIGLAPSEKLGGAALSDADVLEAIRSARREPKNISRVVSASEPTLVVDVQPPLSEREVHDLSAKLGQEGIAQHLGGGEGLLAGPAASSWGEFNPAFFYTQEGDTLGSSLLTDKFRSGAPREDLAALADKWGLQLDPVNLSIMARLRDEAAQAGGHLPSDLGVFTSRQIERDPISLSRYRAGEAYDPQGLQIGTSGPLQAVSGRGVHIGREPGLTTLDPSFYGRGHQGAEYKEARHRGVPDRTHLYVGPEGTVIPEETVLGIVNDQMRKGPRYAYEADLSGLYDINADPEKLSAMATAAGMDEFDLEQFVAKRGYAGYVGDHGPSWDRQKRRSAAVYGPVEVRPLEDGPITDWRRKFAVGGRVGCR